MITSGDAVICGHDNYKAVAVGGTLIDGSPNESGNIKGTWQSSFGALKEGRGGFSFATTPKSNAKLPFEWSDFETLARTAVDLNRNGYRVKVVHQGEEAKSYDGAAFGAEQGEDNGHTLAVFTGTGKVTLVKSRYGRQFGPSVLAPFAQVDLTGDTGYVDGIVIAKSVSCSGQNTGSLQMHGAGYTGPFECKELSPAPPPSSPPPSPPPPAPPPPYRPPPAAPPASTSPPPPYRPPPSRPPLARSAAAAAAAGLLRGQPGDAHRWQDSLAGAISRAIRRL